MQLFIACLFIACIRRNFLGETLFQVENTIVHVTFTKYYNVTL